MHMSKCISPGDLGGLVHGKTLQDCQIGVAKEAISKLKSQVSKCQQAKNPALCESKLKEEIAKWERALERYKKGQDLASPDAGRTDSDRSILMRTFFPSNK